MKFAIFSNKPDGCRRSRRIKVTKATIHCVHVLGTRKSPLDRVKQSPDLYVSVLPVMQKVSSAPYESVAYG